jgi:hypothetical protein
VQTSRTVNWWLANSEENVNLRPPKKEIKHGAPTVYMGVPTCCWREGHKTEGGLIYKEKCHEVILCSYGDEYPNCGLWNVIVITADIRRNDTLKLWCQLTRLNGISRVIRMFQAIRSPLCMRYVQACNHGAGWEFLAFPNCFRHMWGALKASYHIYSISLA